MRNYSRGPTSCTFLCGPYGALRHQHPPQSYFFMGPRAGLSETSEYGKVAPLSQGFSTCEQQ